MQETVILLNIKIIQNNLLIFIMYKNFRSFTKRLIHLGEMLNLNLIL